MDYSNQIYCSLLGMITGTILGSPQEIGPWNAKNIDQVFGYHDEYYTPRKKYAADDDINGPVHFIKAMNYRPSKEFCSQNLKYLWLDIIRYKKGMFWWGPSTERAAYENILKGLNSNECGLSCNTSLNLANQIGGQIFVDTWGMIFAGMPNIAVSYAHNCSSLSHDQNGVEGGKFIAGLISLSYKSKLSIKEDIKRALQFIDSNSDYYKAVENCIENFDCQKNFHKQTTIMIENAGYEELNNFGHIIPNVIICINSLLKGDGDFEQSIKYAVSYGFDTDCNGSTVGSIVGMRSSIECIAHKYLKMINDTVVTSSAIGSENIVTIPNLVKEIEHLRKSYIERSSIKYQNFTSLDFNLPFSTNGFETTDSTNLYIIPSTENNLALNISMMTASNEVRLFKKTMYTSEELQDLRYSPVFAPSVYPMQNIEFTFSTNHEITSNIKACIYVKTLQDKVIEISEYFNISKVEKITATIDICLDEVITEYGLQFKTIELSSNFSFGRILLNQVKINGEGCYVINFNKQISDCESVTPFSHSGGIHNIKRIERQYKLTNFMLEYSSLAGTRSITGAINHKVKKLEYTMYPIYGNYHQIIFNGQGLYNNYKFGFIDLNKIEITTYNDGVETRLICANYNWQHNNYYTLTITQNHNMLEYYINKDKVYAHECTIKYGLHGYISTENCAGYIKEVRVNC